VNELLGLAEIVVRAEEAWEPVIFGGMIPAVGAAAVGYIIYRAVREPPEEQPDEGRDGGPPEPPSP
jgi:hypothetical protein